MVKKNEQPATAEEAPRAQPAPAAKPRTTLITSEGGVTIIGPDAAPSEEPTDA